MPTDDRPRITITRPLTDAELRAADAELRAWYLRVLMLMQLTGCSFTLALRAVQSSDTRAANSVQSH